MGVHFRTPRVLVFDPRGLTTCTIDYWRSDASFPSEPRINRTTFDVAGYAARQWDPRLWALQKTDPQTPPNLTTVYTLSGQVLRSDSVDAGTQVVLPGLAAQVLMSWDSRGTVHEIDYDPMLRPLAVFEASVAQPRQCVERFVYGAAGQGEQARNQFGQLIRHDDQAGSLLFNSFSITGKSFESTRHFALDPSGPDWPEPIEEHWQWLEPGDGATSGWRFGAQGQMLEQVDARGNRQRFEQTVDGRLRACRLQLKGQTVEQSLVSEIHYNADGQVEQETAGNGVRTTLSYRPQDGRLMRRHSSKADGALLQDLTYAYDRMGNVVSIRDQAQPIRYFANQRIEALSEFFYDSLYQLIGATGSEAGAANQGPGSLGQVDPAALGNYRQTYHYDAGGNLLKLSHVGVQGPGRELQVARYSNRGLPFLNGVPPTEAQIAAAYDVRGNLLMLDQGRFVQWNLRNQLQSISPVQRAGGVNDRELYVYDASGQRVRKIRSLQTNARTVINEVRYLPGLELRVDSAGEVLQVISAQTGLNSVNVLHWETPPPTGGNDRYRYTFTDHLGSASVELAEDGRIISQEIYYPFGETAWSREAEVSYRTLRYSGKERDATGLYDYGLRYYIPWLQRWMNPDPIGTVDGLNLYQMVNNSPMVYVDIDGGEKADFKALQESVDKLNGLLTSITRKTDVIKHAMLNHVYLSHRLKGLARRVGVQASSDAASAAGYAIGAAIGTSVGSVVPGLSVLGGLAGGSMGSRAADALTSRIIDASQSDRPINFKGNEMNPKSFIEQVEPKPERIKNIFGAFVQEFTTEVVSQIAYDASNGVLDKIPGYLDIVKEFYNASGGLHGDSLSEVYDHTPVLIDMLEFRLESIKTEFAGSGDADSALFENIVALTEQKQRVVGALEKNQQFIELMAVSPYAGRRHSVSTTTANR